MSSSGITSVGGPDTDMSREGPPWVDALPGMGTSSPSKNPSGARTSLLCPPRVMVIKGRSSDEFFAVTSFAKTPVGLCHVSRGGSSQSGGNGTWRNFCLSSTTRRFLRSASKTTQGNETLLGYVEIHALIYDRSPSSPAIATHRPIFFTGSQARSVVISSSVMRGTGAQRPWMSWFLPRSANTSSPTWSDSSCQGALTLDVV